MIPISIELVNFRAIPYALIDLTDVTIAAICGRNGAGKSSAFTLAPRFALFGDVIKGISMDDLVRRGTQEMAVTFKFEHQGSIYRSIRTRSIKGNGKSTLEFQKLVNDRWESKSAEKIKDTEAVIRELLNLDDETFTASSMIMQGKANEFTSKSAGERKEILQQILGLNVYDQLQESAKQKASGLNIEILKAKAKLADLNAQLEMKDEKDELLADHQRQLIETTNNLVQNESDLKRLQVELVDLQAKATKATELATQSMAIADELAALSLEKLTLTTKLERAEKILANEVEIFAKYAESEELKQKITVLKTKEPRLAVINTELESIESGLKTLATDDLPISKQVEAIERLVANKTILDKAAAEHSLLSADLVEMDKLQVLDQEKLTAFNSAKELANNTRLNFENKRKALDEHIRVLNRKTSMLADSNCIDVTIAGCHFLADAKAAKADLALAEVEQCKLDPLECNILENACELISKERLAIGYDPVKHTELRDSISQLLPFAEQAKQLDAKVELLESLMNQIKQNESNKSAFTERKANLDIEGETLRLELLELPKMELHLTSLSIWANLKDQLAASKEAKESTSQRISAIDLEVTNKTNRRNAIDIESSAIVMEIIDFESKKLLIPEYEQQINAAREQQGLLQVRIGGLQTEIKAFEAAEKEHKRITAEMEPLAKEWTRYQTLIKAFGKDGIPALIIENAVPSLERIANQILSDMTKGKNYLRFETQRELKSKDGIAETLEIIVGDGSGEGKYETFSGGEQLRIDYAIRFALAELLAERAGSKIEWLTIDEGLGSQDPEHRILVLESIKAVAYRFKKVLVITHLEDAQAAFEQRIFFDNSDAGVDIQVA